MNYETKQKKYLLNKAYQDTRLYSIPPNFNKLDERNKSNDYGLVHLAWTLTNINCFYAIIHYLLPFESAFLIQTKKIFGQKINVASKQIINYLFSKYFSKVPFPQISYSWTRHFHELINNKTQKILLMGGIENDGISTNNVSMMVIEKNNDNIISKIYWEKCAHMIKNKCSFSAFYYQGLVMSFGNNNLTGDSENYNIFSQKSIKSENNLPNSKYVVVALGTINDNVYEIIGEYIFPTTHQHAVRYRVFYLDTKTQIETKSQIWYEKNTELLKSRFFATATIYQDKVWLAGGSEAIGQDLTSITVYDPKDDSWNHSGNLCKYRDGKIALFVIKDELYAAGGQWLNGIWIEKMDKETGIWHIIGEHFDGNRYGCSLALCDQTIYFFGGHINNWNSFDTQTMTWASEQYQFREEESRKLPYTFIEGQAVCITPYEQFYGLSSWSGIRNF